MDGTKRGPSLDLLPDPFERRKKTIVGSFTSGSLTVAAITVTFIAINWTPYACSIIMPAQLTINSSACTIKLHTGGC